MKRVAMLMSLGLLTACPGEADLAAAGLEVGDGGVLIPIDAGTTPAVLLGAINEMERLKMRPSDEILCKLSPGDIKDMNDEPHRRGTWLGDIDKILGPVDRNAQQIGKSEASRSYQWSNGGMNLNFERLEYGAATGMPLQNPWFLNEIQIRSPLEYLLCWDDEYKFNYHTTPCPECELPADGQ